MRRIVEGHHGHDTMFYNVLERAMDKGKFVEDVFGLQETRLVTAVASQIGVAIQNAHLVSQDLERQRLRHELQLAHDLQLKLLPSPSTLGPGVDTAAHCQPAESVGGDFYNYLRLRRVALG